MTKPRLAAALAATILLCGCGAAVEEKAGGKTAPKPPAAESEAPVHARGIVFVMARCPHCAEMYRSLLPLQRELEGALSLTIGFVGELDEEGAPAGDDTENAAAMLELCVGRSAKTSGAWFDFLECEYASEKWRSLPGGWKECAAPAGIDDAAVASCLNDGTGREELAMSYAAAASAGISGAPTIFFDGHPYFGERTRDGMLAQICYGGDGGEKTRPSACANVAPPPSVPATLLADSACADPEVCDVEREMAFIRALVPTLELARVDFRSAEGRKLYDLVVKAQGPRTLPLLILDGAIGALPVAKTRFMDYVVPFGEGYVLPLGEGRDPLAEICGNAIDDDGDGLVDCADEGCGGARACRAEKKGRLDLFIMSECPFAKELLPSVDAFLSHMGRDRARVDLRVEFIGSAGADGALESMHGDGEVAEDTRIACAQKAYGKGYRFMEYAVCRARAEVGSDWRACVPKGMSAKEIARCADGMEGRELLAASFDRAAAAGVEASPTWLLNEKLEMDGRTAEEIRTAYCAANTARGCEAPVANVERKEENGGAPPSCE
jgi:hypothetical protein